MTDITDHSEFWEAAFTAKGEMWGPAPDRAAERAAEALARQQARSVLIPGIGYGRNALPFLQHGIQVSGIEIAPTALALARRHFGEALTLYQGSVAAMPFDACLYDGIFCHALIHLLG